MMARDPSFAFYMALRDLRYGPNRDSVLGRWLTDDRVQNAVSVVANLTKRRGAKLVGGVQDRRDITDGAEYAVWQDRGGGWAQPKGAVWTAHGLRQRWSDVLDSAQYHRTCVLPVGMLPEGAEPPGPQGAERFDPYFGAWVLPDGSLWWASADRAREDIERWRQREARQVRDLANISPDFGFAKEPKRELARTRKYIAEAKAWIRSLGS